MEKQIPTNAQNVIDSVEKSFRKILTDKIEDLVLYGSYARGDQEAGSDIDLLMILNEEITVVEKAKVNKVLSEVSLKHDLVVSCFPYQKDDFKLRNTSFLLNVKKEGIVV